MNVAVDVDGRFERASETKPENLHVQRLRSRDLFPAKTNVRFAAILATFRGRLCSAVIWSAAANCRTSISKLGCGFAAPGNSGILGNLLFTRILVVWRLVR